jgi:hypothetical protein
LQAKEKLANPKKNKKNLINIVLCMAIPWFGTQDNKKPESKRKRSDPG